MDKMQIISIDSLYDEIALLAVGTSIEVYIWNTSIDRCDLARGNPVDVPLGDTDANYYKLLDVQVLTREQLIQKIDIYDRDHRAPFHEKNRIPYFLEFMEGVNAGVLTIHCGVYDEGFQLREDYQAWRREYAFKKAPQRFLGFVKSPPLYNQGLHYN